MSNYESLYTWAMERQMSLRDEAARRRMARDARRQSDPPADAGSVELRVISGTSVLDEPAA